MASEENQYDHLQELGGSGYQIVDGEPDITGWEVTDAEGRIVGEVDDVLFDPQTRAVRYIIVDLKENELDIDTGKKVLIPIGIAELRDQYDEDETEEDSLQEVNAPAADPDEPEEYFDEDVVYLPTITAAQLLALPAYETGRVSPEDEVLIRNVFETPKSDAVVIYEKNVFYEHGHFNDKISPGGRIRSGDADSDEYKGPVL